LLGCFGAGIWEEAVLRTADGSHRDRQIKKPHSMWGFFILCSGRRW
jgi:hypothetical protein